VIMNFKKFQPLTDQTKNTVSLLLERGGQIIFERKDYIEIQRLESIARIDQLGRVDWRSTRER
jgi:hypothetical protein